MQIPKDCIYFLQYKKTNIGCGHPIQFGWLKSKEVWAHVIVIETNRMT